MRYRCARHDDAAGGSGGHCARREPHPRAGGAQWRPFTFCAGVDPRERGAGDDGAEIAREHPLMPSLARATAFGALMSFFVPSR